MVFFPSFISFNSNFWKSQLRAAQLSFFFQFTGFVFCLFKCHRMLVSMYRMKRIKSLVKKIHCYTFLRWRRCECCCTMSYSHVQLSMLLCGTVLMNLYCPHENAPRESNFCKCSHLSQAFENCFCFVCSTHVLSPWCLLPHSTYLCYLLSIL